MYNYMPLIHHRVTISLPVRVLGVWYGTGLRVGSGPITCQLYFPPTLWHTTRKMRVSGCLHVPTLHLRTISMQRRLRMWNFEGCMRCAAATPEWYKVFIYQAKILGEWIYLLSSGCFDWLNPHLTTQIAMEVQNEVQNNTMSRRGAMYVLSWWVGFKLYRVWQCLTVTSTLIT